MSEQTIEVTDLMLLLGNKEITIAILNRRILVLEQEVARLADHRQEVQQPPGQDGHFARMGENNAWKNLMSQSTEAHGTA